MKRIYILFIAFLVACSAQPTVIPTSTIVPTQPPTETKEPTPQVATPLTLQEELDLIRNCDDCGFINTDLVFGFTAGDVKFALWKNDLEYFSGRMYQNGIWQPIVGQQKVDGIASWYLVTNEDIPVLSYNINQFSREQEFTFGVIEIDGADSSYLVLPETEVYNLLKEVPPVVFEPPTAEKGEIDLDLNSRRQDINTTYLGVKTSFSIITDSSASNVIKSFTMSTGAGAKFANKSIFDVWWVNGEEKHQGKPSEDEFIHYMELLKMAQESGKKEDWEKVQINIYANDLNIKGYRQKLYTIWPMCFDDSEASESVVCIENITVALVNPSSMQNITVFDNNEKENAYGTNIDIEQKILYIYVGAPYLVNNNLRLYVAQTAWWLKKNKGGAISGYTPAASNGYGDNKELSDLVINNSTVSK